MKGPLSQHMLSNSTPASLDAEYRDAGIWAAITWVVSYVVAVIAWESQLQFVKWHRQRRVIPLESISMEEIAHRWMNDVVHRSASRIDPQIEALIRTRVRAAQRMRGVAKTFGALAGSGSLLCIPGAATLGYFGYASGYVGFLFVTLIAMAQLLYLDPSMPREARGYLELMLYMANGPFVCMCSALAAGCALLPTALGIPSLSAADHPKLAHFNYVLVGMFGFSVVVLIAHQFNVQRALYATHRRLPKPVKELIREQKLKVKAKGWLGMGRIPIVAQMSRGYYLESADYYAVPIRTACEHFHRTMQLFGVLQGAVAIIAAIVAVAVLQSDESIPEETEHLINVVVLGSLLPVGLSFAIVNPILFSAPVRHGFARWIGSIGNLSSNTRHDLAAPHVSPLLEGTQWLSLFHHFCRSTRISRMIALNESYPANAAMMIARKYCLS